MTLDELNQRFAIPGVVRFEAGGGGLARMAVTTPASEAHVYLHGAHVTHYQRRGEKPILWMSEQSQFAPGKPIRGGVPVIFPWFGPRRGAAVASGGACEGASPPHGFARLNDWNVEAVRRDPDGGVTATLAFASSEQTRVPWPHDFALRFTLRVGAALGMTLEVRNTGRSPFTFEEALHTYFTVGDVRRASVRGLAGVTYLSKSQGDTRILQGPQPITFTAETDRVYMNTRSACILDDPALSRTLTIAKTGSDTTVVWNPWVAKSKAMPDFGDEEWPGMVCIETANALDNAVTLAPGASHTMAVEIK